MSTPVDLSNNAASGASTVQPLSSAGVGHVRANLAVQHILGAAHLSRGLASLEQSNPSRPSGNEFDERFGISVSCIFLAVASVEAYVNEIFSDRKDHFSLHDQNLLGLLWVEYESTKTIDKFDLALRLRNGNALDRGSSSVQSLDRLILLRNALTHFKPEWSYEAEKHAQLCKRLGGYVRCSPWLPDESVFPYAWAHSGSTAWAIMTVTRFVSEFSAAAGIQNRLEPFLPRLALAPG
jgi:hypothetical protein